MSSSFLHTLLRCPQLINCHSYSSIGDAYKCVSQGTTAFFDPPSKTISRLSTSVLRGYRRSRNAAEYISMRRTPRLASIYCRGGPLVQADICSRCLLVYQSQIRRLGKARIRPRNPRLSAQNPNPSIRAGAVLLDFKDLPRQFLDMRILNLTQRICDALQRLLRKACTASRVDINARRRKQGLGKIGYRPLIGASMPIAQDLPMRRGDHQPAFPPPVPSPRISRTGFVYAVDALDLLGLETLIGDDVFDTVGALVGTAVGGWEGPVSDLDIALRFPHGQGGVGDVPCAGEPLGGGRGERGLGESGGRGGAEGDRTLHDEMRQPVLGASLLASSDGCA